MTRLARFYSKLIIIFFAVILIGGYAYYQSRTLIQGPQLTIASPQNGSLMTQKLVEVRGTVDHVSRITLNGNPISITEQGMFAEKILLSPGHNAFQIDVKDRFNRTASKTLELVYQPL